MHFARRKRKDGTWSYFADWREGGRHRRYTFKGLVTEKLARLAYGKLELRHAQGKLDIPTEPTLTIADCLTAYLDTKRLNCDAKHVSTLEGRAKQMIEHFGEGATVQSLNEKSIGEFIKALKLTGCAPPTTNRKLGLLKAAIARAVKAGKIAKNPLEHVEALSDARKLVERYLNRVEIDKLLDICEHGAIITVNRRNGRDYDDKIPAPKGLYPLVMFLLHTGARFGEALALHWQDVDFSAGTVRLLTTKRAARGRKAKSRFIPMNPVLKELLQSLERNGDTVLPPVSNVRRKFKRAVELAGLEHCRIHDLRHTFASHLAMNGTPLNTIRELLGHATLTMTLRYAHLSPQVKADAVHGLSFGSKKQVAKVVSMGKSED